MSPQEQVAELDRLHVTMQSNALSAGGLNGVAKGLADGQRALGLAAAVESQLGFLDQGTLLVGAGSTALGRHRVPARLTHFHFSVTTLLQWRRLLRPEPSVVHFHGPWAAEGRFEGNSRLRAAVKKMVELLAYRQSGLLVAHSQNFADLLVREYRISPGKVAVVHPGVDLERFHPVDPAAARSALGLPSGEFIVGSCRRLVPRMGLDTLLRAAARTPGAHVAIAGTGPCLAELRELAAELGIDKRVFFLGYVPDELLNAFYNAIDYTVVPSAALEGFGLVVLESEAAGTPVIASRAGGLAEAMDARDADWLFTPGDVDELTALLGRAAAGRPEPAAVRDRVEGRSWTDVARALETVFAERLKDPSTVTGPTAGARTAPGTAAGARAVNG